MSADGNLTVLIRDIPSDVAQELDRRASVNYRSRSGEILAILTAVCRGGATLPGLGLGDVVPAQAASENEQARA